MNLIILFLKILLAALILRAGFLILHVLLGEFLKFFEFIIVGSDHYWKRKWLLSHRGTKKIEYNNIDIYNPQRGWALIPNLDNKIFNTTTVSSDSAGARGKTGPSDNRGRVLFFGDSFCFGEDVNDDKTIPYLFGEKLKSIQAINLGVHGYGIDQQYLYLKEVGKKYQPKLICFIIYYEDFIRNSLSFRDYAKPKFIFKDGKAILTNYPVPDPEYYLKNSKNTSFFIVFLDFLRQIFLYYGLIGKKRREQICAYLFDQIKQAALDLRSELTFLYIPNPFVRVYKNYIDNFFITLLKNNDTPYLNLADIFLRSELIAIIDKERGHFTARGSKLIADKLADFITKQGIIRE